MWVKLTDRFVKSATTHGRKSPIFMDDEVIRFGVWVRETGRKSFTLHYAFERRRRRLFIGDFPDWSTNSAREPDHLPRAHRTENIIRNRERDSIILNHQLFCSSLISPSFARRSGVLRVQSETRPNYF
jgi:Arm DNA-binding domain